MWSAITILKKNRKYALLSHTHQKLIMALKNISH